jgi:hypothetical protein
MVVYHSARILQPVKRSTGQERGSVTVHTRCSKTYFFCKRHANRKSSARIPIGHRLDDRRIGVRLRAEARDFLFSSTPRPSLEPMKTLIQWATRILSPAVNPIWFEANHSPASSAKVKNTWSYTSIPRGVRLTTRQLYLNVHVPSLLISL